MELVKLQEIEIQGNPVIGIKASQFQVNGYDLSKFDPSIFFDELIFSADYGETVGWVPKTFDVHGPYLVSTFKPTNFKLLTLTQVKADISSVFLENENPEWKQADDKKKETIFRGLNEEATSCFKLDVKGLGEWEHQPYKQWHEFVVISPSQKNFWLIVVGED